jgi:hypothetical protein
MHILVPSKDRLQNLVGLSARNKNLVHGDHDREGVYMCAFVPSTYRQKILQGLALCRSKNIH